MYLVLVNANPNWLGIDSLGDKIMRIRTDPDIRWSGWQWSMIWAGWGGGAATGGSETACLLPRLLLLAARHEHTLSDILESENFELQFCGAGLFSVGSGLWLRIRLQVLKWQWQFFFFYKPQNVSSTGTGTYLLASIILLNRNLFNISDRFTRTKICNIYSLLVFLPNVLYMCQSRL